MTHKQGKYSFTRKAYFKMRLSDIQSVQTSVKGMSCDLYKYNDNCPICLSGVHNETIILDCQHAYHIDCLREWTGDCPLCKKPMTITIGPETTRKAIINHTNCTNIQGTLNKIAEYYTFKGGIMPPVWFLLYKAIQCTDNDLARYIKLSPKIQRLGRIRNFELEWGDVATHLNMEHGEA